MATRYTSPPNPAAFNALVWEAVKKIPPGKVSTYGKLAEMIPVPDGMQINDYRSFAPRWVGGALSKSPPGIPWQRVINAQGKISLRKGRGYEVQRELLEAEGIEFDSRDRIDLSRFGWEETGSY
jgi:methylated-DNA-protein-cysteine methyltransferase related protein